MNVLRFNPDAILPSGERVQIVGAPWSISVRSPFRALQPRFWQTVRTHRGTLKPVKPEELRPIS